MFFFFTLKFIVSYSTMQLKLVLKTKFRFISPTCFTQIPQMIIFAKQFSLIFPRCGGNWFPNQGILFPHWEKQFPSYPLISPISQWFPLIPQFPVQFSIQLHKCTSSLGIRPILCTWENEWKRMKGFTSDFPRIPQIYNSLSRMMWNPQFQRYM